MMADAVTCGGAKSAVLMVMIVVFMGAVNGQTNARDVQAMKDLLTAIDPDGSTLGWSGSTDPCRWNHVACNSNRVTMLKIGSISGLAGKILPQSLRNLTGLTVLELHNNGFNGAMPSLAGMSALSSIMIQNNNFTSIPLDFFSALTSLTQITLDHNPSLAPWSIPESLKDASSLKEFSATQVNLAGTIPSFLDADSFPNLQFLNLAFNNLTGGIPNGFAGWGITKLWLNSQVGGKLSGRIDVVAKMTNLEQLWLHSNLFSGPLPDFTALTSLSYISLRDNQFTGPVPESLTSLPALKNVNLTNNLLQGSVPVFGSGVNVDNVPSSNRYCLNSPGECDQKATLLLSIASSVGYPVVLAQSWSGNDPCSGWQWVTCDSKGNITVINFQNQHFNGTISPSFASIPTLQRLILSNNNLNGTIPPDIAKLPALTLLDVSNNSLWGKIPSFPQNVEVVTTGNPLLGTDYRPPSAPGQSDSGGVDGSGRSKKSTTGIIIGVVIAVICVVCVVGLIVFYAKKRKASAKVQSPSAVGIHPLDSGSDPDMLKSSMAASHPSTGRVTGTDVQMQGVAGSSNIQLVEVGSLTISIQVLRNVTDNFNEANILGKGGFGVVYKGEMHDGTKIAVKRMQSGVISSKGLNEFTSEINVLTRVRHRHLVSLLGYCLDGNEKLLVYEYMPQGTLSRHLFDWKEEGLESLEWKKRLVIALDVGRGVEYLHSLAHQSFIHRDLKPSNILLGDDMRAKVSDFGLVRLAPTGKYSVETKLAGTFGYLAPELTVTGRVTTKTDVFSFGVILMELVTGRRALDDKQPEESMHLVTWFRRMHLNKETFRNVIDPSLEVSTETITSILTVSELACHCCAREPYQRPDMSHVVSVLSPLVDLWKPTEDDDDAYGGVNLDMSLPEAISRWKALEDTQMSDYSVSDSVASLENTQNSTRQGSGFPNSFTSVNPR